MLINGIIKKDKSNKEIYDECSLESIYQPCEACDKYWCWVEINNNKII